MNRPKGVIAGIAAAAFGALLLFAGQAVAQTWPTKVLPAEDVSNTKHNFFLNKDVAFSTTNTTEVCVFCHTPHGGRTDVAAPLWNRAMPDTGAFSYTMYKSPNFDATGPGQPQGVSLACLSCHDGTVGIDSLINAPGSGGFLAANKVLGPDSSMQFRDPALGATLGLDADSSMSEVIRDPCVPGSVTAGCFHNPMGPQTNSQFFAGSPVNFVGSFGMAPFPNLTTDLSDDHPISIQIPQATAVPGAASVDRQFGLINDNFVNSKADGTGVTWLSKTGTLNVDVRDRLRAYPSPTTQSGQFVECASCHNPHTPRPLFLRLPNVAGQALISGGGNTAWSTVTTNAADTDFISNNPNFQSAICLSCHEK